MYVGDIHTDVFEAAGVEIMSQRSMQVKREKDPSLNSEELHLSMIEFRRTKGEKLNPEVVV